MTYENTTHKLNLTGNEISTVLYLVDDYIEGNEYRLSDPDFKSYVDRIYAELQSVTDNYYAQQEQLGGLNRHSNIEDKYTPKLSQLLEEN
jgi:hypothetical protein